MSVHGSNNVGRAVQTDPTLLRYASAITERKKCWELLAEKFDRFQTLRNNTPQHPTTRNRVCKRTQQVTSNNVAPVCTGLNLRQPWRNAGQRMHCFRANTWYRSENPRAVCMFWVLCSSRLQPIIGWIISILRDICRICLLEFFIACPKKNNIAAKFFVSLKQNNSEGFIGAPLIFLALRRDQILVCRLNIRGLKYDFSKFYAKLPVHNFGQKHELQYLEKFAS